MSEAKKPNNSECPRCKNTFLCRADNIQLCDCAQVSFEITPAVRAQIAQQYDGCLCNNCLKQLSEAYK